MTFLLMALLLLAAPAFACQDTPPPHDLKCGQPPISPDESTLVILGDIQELTKTHTDSTKQSPEHSRLVGVFDWLIENRESQRIELVLQVGDLVILGSCHHIPMCDDRRWGNAVEQFNHAHSV